MKPFKQTHRQSETQRKQTNRYADKKTDRQTDRLDRLDRQTTQTVLLINFFCFWTVVLFLDNLSFRFIRTLRGKTPRAEL